MVPSRGFIARPAGESSTQGHERVMIGPAVACDENLIRHSVIVALGRINVAMIEHDVASSRGIRAEVSACGHSIMDRGRAVAGEFLWVASICG